MSHRHKLHHNYWLDVWTVGASDRHDNLKHNAEQSEMRLRQLDFGWWQVVIPLEGSTVPEVNPHRCWVSLLASRVRETPMLTNHYRLISVRTLHLLCVLWGRHCLELSEAPCSPCFHPLDLNDPRQIMKNFQSLCISTEQVAVTIDEEELAGLCRRFSTTAPSDGVLY